MHRFILPCGQSRPRASLVANSAALIPALLALPVALVPAFQLWREDGASWGGDAGWWTLGTVIVLAGVAMVVLECLHLWFGRHVVELSEEGVATRFEMFGLIGSRRFFPADSILLLQRKQLAEKVVCIARLRGGKVVDLAQARNQEMLLPLWRMLAEWQPGKVVEAVAVTKERMRFPWWALALGLVLTGMGGYLAVENIRLLSHGYRVEGRVVRIEAIHQRLRRPPYNSWYVYAPVVRFVDRDGEVRVAQSIYRNENPPHVGDALPGYWSPEEPGDYLPLDAFALFARPGLFLIPGLISLVLALRLRE